MLDLQWISWTASSLRWKREISWVGMGNTGLSENISLAKILFKNLTNLPKLRILLRAASERKLISLPAAYKKNKVGCS